MSNVFKIDIENNVTLEQVYGLLESAITKICQAKISIEKNELILDVPTANIIEVLAFLRDDNRFEFKQLVDLFAIDYLDRDKRFEVVYNLLSLKYNIRLRVRLSVAQDEHVPTATEVFSSAGWLEREVWDMYGVFFAKHSDLRRILTDYGFSGHPQRKDFPLTGYVEVHYSESEKRVVYAPVQLQQEFRNFDFESPWEGAGEYILSLEQKAK